MTKQRKKGLGSASSKLAELGFDPLEAQINMYNKLLAEIEYQEQCANGTNTVKRLNKDGSEKAYRPDYHMNLVMRAAELAEKLNRYGYARVDESGDGEEKKSPILVIGLSDGTEVRYGDGTASSDPE